MSRQSLFIVLALTLLGGLLFALLPGGGDDARLEAFFRQSQASPEIQEAYRFAMANPQVLEAMPCYCGCHNRGHRHNGHCFRTDDGRIDPHGLNCGMCVSIALEAKRLHEAGVSLPEIRRRIDRPFHEHPHLEPTPTPVPTGS